MKKIILPLLLLAAFGLRAQPVIISTNYVPSGYMHCAFRATVAGSSSAPTVTLNVDATGTNFAGTAYYGGLYAVSYNSYFNTSSNEWVVFSGGSTFYGFITNTVGANVNSSGTPYYVWHAAGAGQDDSYIQFDVTNTTAVLVTNTLPPLTVYTTGLTNFWSVPGDLVTFSASGKNLAVSGVASNYLTVLIGTNVVLASPWAAGNRLPWSVAGTLQWDGTNLDSTAHMVTGDTNAPFGDAYSSVPISTGTNTFTLTFGGFTNTLTLDTANITAIRAPIGDVVSHTYPPVTASSGGGSTNSAGITNFVFTTTNLPAGSAATSTITGITNGIAYVFLGVPAGSNGAAGAAGTNTVTSYNFTNQMLQSKQITVYQTNYAFWSASNYLGRVPGIVSWTLSSGDDGGANPSTAPATFPMTLYGTYATNFTSWFPLTNGFVSQSNISLYAALGTNNWGTTLANPGAAYIFSVDHWELYSRTNTTDYQFMGSKVPPVLGWQFVTKDYVGNLFGSAFNNNFATARDSNAVTHFYYSSQNKVMFDLTSSTIGVPPLGFAPGAYATYTDPSSGLTMSYPTNEVLTIASSNLTSSYILLAQTNLTQTFFPYTNFTVTTAGGITSLAIQIIPGAGQWFFYAANGFNFGAQFNEPVSFTNGLTSTLATTNCLGLADTNKTGHTLYLYASTNGGSPALYIHGSGTEKIMSSRDYSAILTLQSVCTVVLVVFAITHTRWHVRRHLQPREQACPVCKGAGQVPESFYPMGVTCGNNGYTWCQTCKGQGILSTTKKPAHRTLFE